MSVTSWRQWAGSLVVSHLPDILVPDTADLLEIGGALGHILQ